MATFIPPAELLNLYATGWFPMAMEDGSIRCFSPDPRGIIPLEDFRVPHGSQKIVRDPKWELKIDSEFEQVLRACAKREETWISEPIIESYLALHQIGQAHSFEIWREGHLAGGLYGVRLGTAFFGESMFSAVPGASKVALTRLVDCLRSAEFQLLDTQWITPHLKQFGAISISRKLYLKMLEKAVHTPAQWR